MNNSPRNYQQMNISTASPMELIVMLYDDAIRALEKAEAAFAIEGPTRIEQINNNLLHAQDVITELAVSLDLEKGGEIAYNLQRLYDFMVNHISNANINKQVQPVADVLRMMRELREAWREVASQEQPREESAALPAARTGTISIAG